MSDEADKALFLKTIADLRAKPRLTVGEKKLIAALESAIGIRSQPTSGSRVRFVPPVYSPERRQRLEAIRAQGRELYGTEPLTEEDLALARERVCVPMAQGEAPCKSE